MVHLLKTFINGGNVPKIYGMTTLKKTLVDRKQFPEVILYCSTFFQNFTETQAKLE